MWELPVSHRKIWKCTHYVYELLKNFCKLAKTNRSNNKLSKTGFGWSSKHCLGNSPVNSIPESTVFFHNFSLQKKRQKLVRADSIHSQREIVFDSDKKNSLFPLDQGIKLHVRAPWHCCEISPLSPFWSGSVTTFTRGPPTLAWIRADIWHLDGAISSKIRKVRADPKTYGLSRLWPVPWLKYTRIHKKVSLWEPAAGYLTWEIVNTRLNKHKRKWGGEQLKFLLCWFPVDQQPNMWLSKFVSGLWHRFVLSISRLDALFPMKPAAVGKRSFLLPVKLRLSVETKSSEA